MPSKTQIVYPVGGGSVHDNAELRWSLRSLEKFARDEVEPIVVGSVPSWYSGTAVPFEETTGRKAKNILAKVLHAIEVGAVRGAFQISADDHFWVSPTLFGLLPIYFREGILPTWEGVGNNYVKAMGGTREVLLENGYTALNTTCHCNAWCHSDDAWVVRMLLESAEENALAREYGLLAWAVWPNVWLCSGRAERYPVVYRRDIKIGTIGLEKFRATIGSTNCFSINDEAFDSPCVMEYLKGNFGKKCRWEK